MTKTKKQKRAETKERDTRPAKKEYRASQSENGRTHQTVYTIYQKITWKSELGKKEEWVKVREWRIGIKTGETVKEILTCIQAASKGETLPEHPQATSNHSEANEDADQDEEESEWV